MPPRPDRPSRKGNAVQRLLYNLVAVVCAVVGSPGIAAADDWHGWRGPTQDGHSHETGLPERWTAENVVWTRELPGLGQSSPVVTGERILLTSALDEGRERVVICLDRHDGSILWQETAWTGQPEPTHPMNGWASATCATDGERVYAFFGRGGGLVCYSLEGEKLWQNDLGALESPWGTAACPRLVGDLVVQNCDADSDASIVAFHKVTGEEVWRTPRPANRGWSSPIVIEANVAGGSARRTEVVVNSHTGVRAYDPSTGEELWNCRSFNGRGTPTVAPAGGLLHVVNGLSGDTYAIIPGGSGDVTETHMAWHTERGGRDLPSPIIVDGVVLVSSLRSAVITGYDAESGKELWKTRVGDQISASPVAWGGLAYFVKESGVTIAVDPQSGEVVSESTVDPAATEVFRASITPAYGRVLLRSDSVLYCIGG
ncbi:MAG: hypothetical protein DWQ29_24795 [Planctomycetota bacterium]|nr:MAG: hypothetical protein DWQ29_24795 [Planctomycetota bacterium]